mmetsp:Transcript_2268/g.4317  ORF Transcript_2268/g.4317 Transcript_2268/m.4317 type:complete len:413 (-) Transcript_2268:573-1811(-)
MDSRIGRRRVQRLTAHLARDRHGGKATLGRKGLARSNARALRGLSLETIREKRSAGQLLIVIRRKVYDVTEFTDQHPGGADILAHLKWDNFKLVDLEFDMAQHSEDALEEMQDLLVGRVLEEGEVESQENGEIDDNDEEENDDEEALAIAEARHAKLNENRPFTALQHLDLKLVERSFINHDVMVLRFALPRPDQALGLPIGQHLILSFTQSNGHVVNRPYTPISAHGEVGFVELLIKRYPLGKMSNFLSTLPLGNSIRVRGPKGKLEYRGHGNFFMRKQERKFRHVGMIAGGSGLTPMFQILQAIALNPRDHITITLLFANKTEHDVLLPDRLATFVKDCPNVTVHHTLDSPPPQWKGYKGFITSEMISQVMPPPDDDVLILLCGPSPMVKKACIPALRSLGYPRTNFFTF